jgi:hypothetical protein
MQCKIVSHEASLQGSCPVSAVAVSGNANPDIAPTAERKTTQTTKLCCLQSGACLVGKAFPHRLGIFCTRPECHTIPKTTCELCEICCQHASVANTPTECKNHVYKSWIHTANRFERHHKVPHSSCSNACIHKRICFSYPVNFRRTNDGITKC